MHQAKPLVHGCPENWHPRLGAWHCQLQSTLLAPWFQITASLGEETLRILETFMGKHMDESDEHGWNLTPPKKKWKFERGGLSAWWNKTKCCDLTWIFKLFHFDVQEGVTAHRNIKLYKIYTVDNLICQVQVSFTQIWRTSPLDSGIATWQSWRCSLVSFNAAFRGFLWLLLLWPVALSFPSWILIAESVLLLGCDVESCN